MALLIGVIIFVLVSAVADEETGLLLALVIGFISLYITTRSSIKTLQAQLLDVRRQLLELKHKAPPSADSRPQPAQASSQSDIKPGVIQPVPVYEKPAVAQAQPVSPAATPKPADPWNQETRPAATPTEPTLLDKAWNALWSVVKGYFTDGNVFVRIGILILFVGVSFLLKYAAEHSDVPIEFRISGVALGGLALLYLGWRLRQSKGVYALLLQGAGIGVMYMSIFAAYKIYELLPSLPTFGLLAGLAVFSALLAVVQDSKALAAFGITGGFVAPILASSGSGDYVALFNYFIVLNLGVLAMAWYKSWRIVNLLAFGFTFLIYTVWMFDSYRTEYLISADAFLIVFFLIFSLASVLFAQRQPLQLKGYVDGTLVFGNPLIVWGLHMALMDDVEYGIAVSAFVFGLYHVVLARVLWNRDNAGMRLFSESLLSIGVIFLTLAIPYSMDGHWTSATWALEGAGILWVSLRQQRKLPQYFAVLLQLASAIVFFIQYRSDASLLPVLNPYYLGGIFIAASGFFSAWQLCKYNKVHPAETLPRIHVAAFVWSMLWWVMIHLSQIELYVHSTRGRSQVMLLFAITTSFLAWQLAKRLGWKLAEITAVASIAAFILVGVHAMLELSPPFELIGVVLWVLALGYAWWLLSKVELMDTYTHVIVHIHTTVAVLAIALLSAEVVWLLNDLLPYLGEGWVAGYWFIVPAAALFYLLRARHWPLLQYNGRVQQSVMAIMLAYLVGWSLFVNLSNNGDPDPLFYLPVLNPLDVMHVFMFVLAYRSYQLFKVAHQPSPDSVISSYALKLAAVLVFIWINTIVLRSIHHFDGVVYRPDSLADSALVQVSLSILWTIMGMLAMIFAARRSLRRLWIAGAILVGIVLLKLVTIDLSSHDTVERIVSFIAVGLLLVGMGYFSPIPEKSTQE